MNRFASLLTAATFAAALALPCGAFAQSSNTSDTSKAPAGSTAAGDVTSYGNPSGPGAHGTVSGPGMGGSYKSSPSFAGPNQAGTNSNGRRAENGSSNMGSAGNSNQANGSNTGNGNGSPQGAGF